MNSGGSDRPQVTFYGNDQGANNVLDCVQTVAAETFAVQRIPGLNVPIAREAVEQARKSAAVVLGLSTGRPEAAFARELLAQNSSLSGRLIFVEDFPGTAATEPQAMQDIAPAATACTILPDSDEELQRFGYGGNQTVGAPDHWARILENMHCGRELRQSGELQMRKRGQDECVPVDPDTKIIYVSGFYDPQAEYNLLAHLLKGVSYCGGKSLVHFRAHPGEKNRPELQEGITRREDLLAGKWEIANEDVAQAGRDSDARLAGVADAIVIHPGATIVHLAVTFCKNIVAILELASPSDWATGYDFRLAEHNTHLIEHVSDCRAALRDLFENGSGAQRTLAEKQAKCAIPFDPHEPMGFGKKVMEVMRKVVRM